MRVYTYGPPAPGNARLKPANTSASNTAPLAVNSHALPLFARPYDDNDAGNRKMPDPIMLPTTSAVHITGPSSREPSLPCVVIDADPRSVAALYYAFEPSPSRG